MGNQIGKWHQLQYIYDIWLLENFTKVSLILCVSYNIYLRIYTSSNIYLTFESLDFNNVGSPSDVIYAIYSSLVCSRFSRTLLPYRFMLVAKVHFGCSCSFCGIQDAINKPRWSSAFIEFATSEELPVRWLLRVPCIRLFHAFIALKVHYNGTVRCSDIWFSMQENHRSSVIKLLRC